MRNVAASFRDQPVAALQCSPQPRARQSARIVAEALSLDIEEVAAADELDFGEWTGLSFASLDRDPRWRQWNEHRATAVPPRGESMRELQRRFSAHIAVLARSNDEDAVVVISHAEPIRAVLLGCLELSLDRYAEIAIDPASISTIQFDGDRKRVVCINRRCKP